MIIKPTAVDGAYLIEIEAKTDERGFFARVFDNAIFADRGMESVVSQCNLSHSTSRGTLRGLHYQAAPNAEARFVRCIRGRVFDVVVDVRDNSLTAGQWFTTELSALNHNGIYAPPGTAHGFLTLEDDSEVLYMASAPYVPASERGIRWNDPAFAIDWPLPPSVLTEKDGAWPDFSGRLDP